MKFSNTFLPFSIIFFLARLISGKVFIPEYYDNAYYNDDAYNQSSTTQKYNETSYDGPYDFGNYLENYPGSRIRYLKAVEVNVNVTIDIKLSIPLPGGVGSLDIDIPISILIQNKTVFKFPYPDPPLKFPLFYPVIKLPKLPSFLTHSNNYFQDNQDYQENYPYSVAYSNDHQQDQLANYHAHPRHRLAKRSLAAQSAVHRYEIFCCIEKSLEQHGYLGRSCLLRAICQLAQQELLIESAFHEVVEHLLTISRGVDEDDLLSEYQKAEEYGATSGSDCHRKYACAFSIFEPLEESSSLEQTNL